MKQHQFGAGTACSKCGVTVPVVWADSQHDAALGRGICDACLSQAPAQPDPEPVKDQWPDSDPVIAEWPASQLAIAAEPDSEVIPDAEDQPAARKHRARKK